MTIPYHKPNRLTLCIECLCWPARCWSSVIWMMTQITMTNLKPPVCSAERTPCRVSARCQASGQRRLTARSCTSVKLGFTETFHVDGVQQRKSSGRNLLFLLTETLTRSWFFMSPLTSLLIWMSCGFHWWWIWWFIQSKFTFTKNKDFNS